MLKIERQKLIEDELLKNGFILVPEMGEKLSCSEETIRRDLKEMEKSGRLVRTHGGAFIPEKYDKSYPTELRKSLLKAVKVGMAAVAMRHIKENDMIMLDSSTTCLALAKAIIEARIHLTIITNSLPICSLCSEPNSGEINLICVGGTFRRQATSFADHYSVSRIERYCPEISFISPPKLSMEKGLSDNILSESLVREAMLKQAQKKCIIADHTKFSGDANILFKGLNDLDLLITDEKLSDEWEVFSAQQGISVEYI